MNLFKCSECGRKCNHVTTKWDTGDVSYIDEGESLCAWCVTKRKKGESETPKQKLMRYLQSMNKEERQQFLEQLT